MSSRSSEKSQGWVRYLVRRCLEHRGLVIAAGAGALVAALLTA